MLLYHGGGYVEGKKLDGTDEFTYTDLDDMLMQSAPAGGDLYYYTYGFDDVSGDARIIALASSMSVFDVVEVIPAHEAVDVLSDATISIEFTQQPLLSTISSSTVKLEKVEDSSSVAYTIVTCKDRVLVIRPDDELASESQYMITVTTDVTALDTTALPEEHVYTFTTAVPDGIEVVSTDPADDSTDFGLAGTILITCDSNIDEATVAGSLSISPAVDLVPQVVDNVLTIGPSVPFDENTEYTITLSTTFANTDGGLLEEEYSFSFTTEAVPMDIITSSPADSATDVPCETAEITIEFDRDIDESTVTESSLVISPALVYSVSSSGAVLTLSFDALDSATTYTMTLNTDIKSMTGGALNAEHVISFTTGLLELPSCEVTIEGPGQTYASVATIILRPPVIESVYPSKWLLHFALESYYEVISGTEEDPISTWTLIEAWDSVANPALFQYTINNGATWEKFPALGLPPTLYESFVRVDIRCGQGTEVKLIPYCGAEPA
jgi:hypothetical protein